MIEIEKLKPENLNGIYMEIADDLGIEIAQMIFNHYKGLQITFPTRFLSREYILQEVNKEYKGNNIKQLAKKYGYSDRWIRKIIENFKAEGMT